MRYEFIKTHALYYPIDLMCRLLQVSRSGYYRWKKQPESLRVIRKKQIAEQIKAAYFKAKGLYGSPRLSVELSMTVGKISRTSVASHMRDMKLQSKRRRSYRVTTDSTHKEPICENLLNRDFKPTSAGSSWVSDITYIPVEEGFLYLTTVLDLFDRKVIGWSISEGMSTQETTIKAFNMAIRNRKPTAQMIFHSDRGVQYASTPFRNLIASYGCRQSMSRKGNCWDNAVAESFFKSLKTEMIYGYKKQSKEKMRTELFEYIEIWYNRRRRHSYLKNLTLEEFWDQLNDKNTKLLNVA
ncbi:MAG: IS3 family transposase [Phocaeicola sp.]